MTIIHMGFMTLAMAALLGGATLNAEDTVVHISQTEAVKAAKEKVQPEYPAMAKQLHLEGTVQVEAHIGSSGTVEEVKPLTGNAVLMNAAVTALKKWKFTPFTADGKPTKAVADLSFSFKL
jgi:protein TonB